MWSFYSILLYKYYILSHSITSPVFITVIVYSTFIKFAVNIVYNFPE